MFYYYLHYYSSFPKHTLVIARTPTPAHLARPLLQTTKRHRRMRRRAALALVGGQQTLARDKGGEARQRPFWDAKVAQRLLGVGCMQRLRPSGWKEGWNAEKSLARKTKIK